MDGMTIGTAYNLMRNDWFRPGNEDSRLDSVTWLAKPTSKMPGLIQNFAQNAGISNLHAVELAKIIDDTEGARMSHSTNFLDLPIAALETWYKAGALFQKNLHNPDSSGASHSKLMHGQYRGESYKPGLISVFNGDKFLAYMAYFMAFGGMRAIRDVQRCLIWDAEKVKKILLVAIRESHQMLKKIGKRGLTWLSACAGAGFGFFTMFFAVLQGRAQIKAMTMGSAKKAPKALAAVDDTEDEDGGEDEVTDILPAQGDDGPTSRIGDPDYQHDGGDAEITDAHHAAADEPPDSDPSHHGFDDPNQEDTDDPDPGAKLKMGRELAYEMLRQARRTGARNQRYRDLMDAADERILLDALQKGLRPTDLEVAERMANFLSFCWQWSERSGIFMEPSHRKKLDMPIDKMIKQIVSAARSGYWETGDNRPLDNQKIWMDVVHEGRNGRPRVAVLTRPISPQLKAKPCDIKGRMIVVNPDHAALREYFFLHIKARNTWPREENTRFFIAISVDGEHEMITAQRKVHPRGHALINARSLDDMENAGQPVQIENAEVSSGFDFPEDDRTTIRMIASATGAGDDVIQRAVNGDPRALGMLAHTCRALPEDRKAVIEATFSPAQREAEMDEAATVDPACLNQTDRQDLARMLNMDLRTMEKAFLDDSDSSLALRRAIKAMPNHLRNLAIQRLHIAARRT